MAMPDYRKLKVFELAVELSEEVHVLATASPSRLAPGLAAQLCRAVSSIPANIAEGAGRESPRQYVRYLTIARGSAQEASVHLRLAARLDNKRAREFQCWKNRADVVAAMLTRLIVVIRQELQDGKS